MIHTPRQLVDVLGGYRQVAARVNVKPTTMHSHMSAEKLPAKYYEAMCLLADERMIDRPSRAVFDFAKLFPRDKERDAA